MKGTGGGGEIASLNERGQLLLSQRPSMWEGERAFEGKAFKQNFVVVYIELDNQLPEVQKNSGFLKRRQSSKQRSDQDLRQKFYSRKISFQNFGNN